MPTYTLRLEFGGGDVEKGQLPGAMARIALKHWSQDEDGRPLVSHQCMGPTELEAEVHRLKGELDVLLAQGQRRFRDYGVHTVAAIRQKHGQ